MINRKQLHAHLDCDLPTNNHPDFIQKKLHDYFHGRVAQSWQGGHILKGKKPESNAIIISSNDYLSLSHHPALIQAQINALQQYGNGQMQSAVFQSETSQMSADCEASFANFLNYPSALLTQSGWCANTGLIQALASPGVPVYLDFYAHMSFWEGVKSAHAKPVPFRHNSFASLAQRIQRFGAGIIVVDAIYSTLGTVCPLADYVALAKENKCLLIVDESHALGVFGPQGRGLVAASNLTEEVDFITASLAKAVSGRGGLIAGSHPLIEMIRYNAYPAIFSSAILPHDLAGFNEVLQIFQMESWRREKLINNANFFREELTTLGVDLKNSQSQIFPLFCGTESDTLWLRNELESYNIYGAVFCAPATPKNEALIRLSLNTNHNLDQLAYICDCLKMIKKKNSHCLLFKR